MLDLREHWQAKKALAEKLYSTGMKAHHDKLLEKAKEHAVFAKEREILCRGQDAVALKKLAPNTPPNMDGDEYVAHLKERLKNEQATIQQRIKAESAFPVSFDGGLGPLLDKLKSHFKDSTEKRGDEREKAASRTLVVISKYRADISDRKEQLAKGNPQIADLLKNTLTEIEKSVRSQAKQLAPIVDDRVWQECSACIDDWEDAKKKSQKLFKALSKEAVQYLKSEKLAAYPLKFNRGLGDALRAFKNLTSSKETLSKMRSEVMLSVKAYRSDISEIEKKYKRITLPGFSRDAADIFEPLEKSLEKVEKRMA